MAWTFAVAVGPAHALNPELRISQYGHTAWRIRDGTPPSSPSGTAQTSDGYFWVGTQSGLVRFDGVRFVNWRSPGKASTATTGVQLLRASRNGGLWIGTLASLSQLEAGALKDYPLRGGFPSTLFEDGRGDLWFGLDAARTGPQGLCRAGQQAVKCFGTPDGLLIENPCCITALTQDTEGNFWIGDDTKLTRWRPGTTSQTFAPAALKRNARLTGIYGLQIDRYGTVWVGMGIAGFEGGLQRFRNGKWQPFIVKGFDSSALVVQDLLLDSRGSLWIATLNQGLYRIHAGAVDHFRASDGLSGDTVLKLLEDREGSIWVTTSQGIDQLRDIKVATLSTREGVSADEVDSLLARRDGSLYIGTSAGLDILRGGVLSTLARLANHQVTSMLEDHAGRLWVGVETQMLLFESGKFTPVRRPDGTELGLVTDMAEDSSHDVWLAVSAQPRELLRLHDRKVVEVARAPQIPEARKIAADPAGGVWLGLVSGDLARYRNGHIETFSYEHQREPMQVPRVNQINVLNDGSVLAATGYGLIGWRNGTQRIFTTCSALPDKMVYGFVSGRDGDLWLDTACGYVRVGADGLAAWWRSGASPAASRTLDVFEGAHSSWAPFKAAARLPDGKLYFGTQGGVQIIDPARLGDNRIVPPVRLEGVMADHRSYSALRPLSLPPLTRDLEVDYTGLSFVMPQRMSFRYKLDGHDDAWTNAGNRRQAFYTDLPPGNYSFQVTAANSDGVWNPSAAVLALTIPPRFYQTKWFLGLVAIAVVAVLGCLLRLRIAQVKSRIRAQLEARLTERERIARELHDTFMQSVQGLVIKLQHVMEDIPRESGARLLMARALDRADEVIAEGRDRVSDLRASSGTADQLPRAIAARVEELAGERHIKVTFKIEGMAVELSPVVAEELQRIVDEALTNACRHARAQNVGVELRYARKGITLQISDDGCGFDAAALQQDPPEGHFGLRGLRERAAKLRGKLEIESRFDAGTVVRMYVSARMLAAGPLVLSASRGAT